MHSYKLNPIEFRCFLIPMSILWVITCSSLSAQTKTNTRAGFTVNIDESQQNLDIKEVTFLKSENTDTKLFLEDDSEVDDRKFYLDKREKLWDIHVDKKTIAWCNDPLTLTFSNKIFKLDDSGQRILNTRNKFWRNRINGVRFIFEPNFGPLLNQKDNKITLESFASIPKIGLETNLHKSWLGLQGIIFYPGIIEFDEQSPIKTSLRDQPEEDELTAVDVDFGWAIGLTLFDGVLVVGYGKLDYDDRDFLPNTINSFKKDAFFYINLQPIASVRKAIAALNSN